MKRFTALLVTAILLISIVGVLTALAGVDSVTINGGPTSIQAGKTYEYTVTVKATGYNFSCDVSSSGAFNVKHVDCDTGRDNDNGSLSKTVKISVTVDSGANIGDKGYIKVKGQGCYIDTETGNPANAFSITGALEASVVNPSSPTPRPSTESGSSAKSVKATAAPTEWDIAAASVEAMQQGGSLTVEITNDPKIPTTILASVKEKQGTLTLNFDGYTCAIDGKALGSLPESAESVDLSMSMVKNEALSSGVSGKDAYQLHFAHQGQLPGKLSYKFKAENNKPGDILYLYYYYSQSGVCEGLQSATVDENGYVTFEIYHCSSYIVSASAIEGAAGADFTSESASALVLQEAQDNQAKLETQLEDAQNTAKELQSQIDTLKADVAPGSPLAASASKPAEQLFGVPNSSLIAALAGTALISMFITMLICRVGIFRKKEVAREKIDKMI